VWATWAEYTAGIPELFSPAVVSPIPPPRTRPSAPSPILSHAPLSSSLVPISIAADHARPPTTPAQPSTTTRRRCSSTVPLVNSLPTPPSHASNRDLAHCIPACDPIQADLAVEPPNPTAAHLPYRCLSPAAVDPPPAAVALHHGGRDVARTRDVAGRPTLLLRR
jgi:hypothetical protein